MDGVFFFTDPVQSCSPMTRMVYDFLFVSVPDQIMVRYVIGDFEVAGQQPILPHGKDPP